LSAATKLIHYGLGPSSTVEVDDRELQFHLRNFTSLENFASMDKFYANIGSNQPIFVWPYSTAKPALKPFIQ